MVIYFEFSINDTVKSLNTRGFCDLIVGRVVWWGVSCKNGMLSCKNLAGFGFTFLAALGKVA